MDVVTGSRLLPGSKPRRVGHTSVHERLVARLDLVRQRGLSGRRVGSGAEHDLDVVLVADSACSEALRDLLIARVRRADDELPNVCLTPDADPQPRKRVRGTAPDLIGAEDIQRRPQVGIRVVFFTGRDGVNGSVEDPVCSRLAKCTLHDLVVQISVNVKVEVTVDVECSFILHVS